MPQLFNILLLITSILMVDVPKAIDDCPPNFKTSCSRVQLEGFWYYADAPNNTILRNPHQVGEQIADLGIMINYDIKWQDGCNHDLIVKQVYFDEKVPNSARNAHIFYPGEVIHHQVTAVWADSIKYKVTIKGITTCEQTLYRVPKELYDE
ncbi:MAG: hypothetical protein CMD31_12995 [Flavobacteriales bacterium]|nr:hypothetical protein [Flavobacteriales bacterium]